MMTQELIEQVLQKLGLPKRPANDLAGLEALYGRWCRKVPFDNLLKRLYLTTGATGPMPGHSSEDFFSKWLAHGTGGTCWAVTHGLCDLLNALGFNAKRASCTMLASPTTRGPNHGTVVVTLDNAQYLIDGYMLTEQPLPLQEGDSSEVRHPAARIPFQETAGHWQFFCRPLHRPDGMWCRIDRIGVSASTCNQYYEGTRGWSPFNYSVHARINSANQISGLLADQKITINSGGQVNSETIQGAERVKFLVEQFGIAEEIISQLPPDEPLPPRPTGS